MTRQALSSTTAGLCVPLGRVLGYAVLLLEQGVLCVLPMLWAALLFSEAGWDFWTCCVPAVSPRQRAGEGVTREGGVDRKYIDIYKLHQEGGKEQRDKSNWLKLQIGLNSSKASIVSVLFQCKGQKNLRLIFHSLLWLSLLDVKLWNHKSLCTEYIRQQK